MSNFFLKASPNWTDQNIINVRFLEAKVALAFRSRLTEEAYRRYMSGSGEYFCVVYRMEFKETNKIHTPIFYIHHHAICLKNIYPWCQARLITACPTWTAGWTTRTTASLRTSPASPPLVPTSTVTSPNLFSMPPPYHFL